MIPGVYRLKSESIECNKGRQTCVIPVSNTGDRPIQVGSHYHFAEVNRNLSFARDKAIGMRLNIAAGTAERFEPGEEKEIELVQLGGNTQVHGLNNLTNGSIEQKQEIYERIKSEGFKGVDDNQ
jgi:urease subunit beta